LTRVERYGACLPEIGPQVLASKLNQLPRPRLISLPSGIAALFQDAVANALAATAINHSQSGAADTIAHPHALVIEFEHVPATVSLITYRIRVGASSGNISVNASSAGGRRFGGASRATLVVEELLT
jgi:hypothetical protein